VRCIQLVKERKLELRVDMDPIAQSLLCHTSVVVTAADLVRYYWTPPPSLIDSSRLAAFSFMYIAPKSVNYEFLIFVQLFHVQRVLAIFDAEPRLSNPISLLGRAR
jgi:hypothetical protein